MNASHISTATLAKEMRVSKSSVCNWLRQGRLFAEKRGPEWWIPIDDARLFARRYAKQYGEPLSPSTEGLHRSPRATNRVTRASVPQYLSVHLSPEAVRHLDEVRRASCEKLSRSAVIERAILEYRREQ